MRSMHWTRPKWSGRHFLFIAKRLARFKFLTLMNKVIVYISPAVSFRPLLVQCTTCILGTIQGLCIMLGMKVCINLISRSNLSERINIVRSTNIIKEVSKVWAYGTTIEHFLNYFVTLYYCLDTIQGLCIILGMKV